MWLEAKSQKYLFYEGHIGDIKEYTGLVPGNPLGVLHTHCTAEVSQHFLKKLRF